MPAVTLDAHLGLGTPYGYAGMAVGWSPISWGAIEGGVGVNSRGPQGVVMARLRLPLSLVFGSGWREQAFGAGGGLSVGAFQHSDDLGCVGCSNDPATYDYSPAVFGNLEVALDVRTLGGFELRPYIGEARLLNPGSARCVSRYFDMCAYSPPREVMGYVGISLGHAFRL